MQIEDVCEVSRGSISEVTYAEARTATEMRILKQRSFAANDDIQKALQKSIEKTIDIADYYCTLYNIVPEGDYEVAYSWDDSIIVDKDTERQQERRLKPLTIKSHNRTQVRKHQKIKEASISVFTTADYCCII